MKWSLIIIAIFLVIALTTVKISLEYKREKENDVISIGVRLWFGLIHFRYHVPLLRVQSIVQGIRVNKATVQTDGQVEPKKKFRLTPEEIQQYWHRFYELKLRIHDLNEIAKKTLRSFKCEEFEWKTRVGIGDAAATGVVTGLIWGVKSNILGLFSHYISLRTKPKIQVIPAFQSNSIDTYFRCILYFRIGNAIIAGIRILINIRKGREGKWQTTLFRA